MKKIAIIVHSVVSFLLLTLTACSGDEKKAQEVIRPEPKSFSFTEEFDDVAGLANKGWVILNNSEPGGPTGWRQGKYEARFDSKNGQVVDGFPAFSAQKAPTDFVSADLHTGSGRSTISSWLISAPIAIKNGDTLSFYSRTKGTYPDRMEVRANLTNHSTNVGNSATSVGDFTTLWLTINPSLTLSGYPNTWRKYTIPITGLANGALINTRIAFRYFVIDGGPNGANSDMIGIDQLKFFSK
jgi:hypothetical protein